MVYRCLAPVFCKGSVPTTSLSHKDGSIPLSASLMDTTRELASFFSRNAPFVVSVKEGSPEHHLQSLECKSTREINSCLPTAKRMLQPLHVCASVVPKTVIPTVKTSSSILFDHELA